MNIRVLEDLHWLANSPALVTSEALQCPTVGSLPAVTPPPSELAQAIHTRQSPRFKLGAYFEALAATQLHNTPGVSQLRRNTVIRQDKRTLGELDILFRNPQGQTEHWEVAIKFYLFAADHDPDPDLCFLGPRTVDRLDRKVQRMREHQLQMPNHPAAREIIGSDDGVQTRALVRGRLFYPLRMDWQSCRLGTLATADHLRGWWTPLRASSQLPPARRYLVVDKRDWLTCPPLGSDSRVHELDALATSLAGLRYPVQVIALDGNDQELHRGFVVPDGWPKAGPT